MSIRQLLFVLFLSPMAAQAAELTLGPHFEVIHPSPGCSLQ